MRRVIWYLAISVSAALLLTAVTFFVEEGVTAPVPGDPGASEGATVRGFPIPYVTVFCCVADGVNSYGATFYHESSLAANFVIWLAISLAGVATFKKRALLAAGTAGACVTLATLLVRPLSEVAPGYGAETDILRPMGFPYEYVTYYLGGLPGAMVSEYQFNLAAALADYALWTGTLLAVLGIVLAILKSRQERLGPALRTTLALGEGDR